MQNIRISRYPQEVFASSELYKMDDALEVITFLKAEDYVTDKLVNQYNKSKISAKRIFKRISCHANLAGQYAKVSLESPAQKYHFYPGATVF